jgi:hypothetical protein
LVDVKKGADGGGYIERGLKVGSLKVCKPILVVVLGTGCLGTRQSRKCKWKIWVWMPGIGV